MEHQERNYGQIIVNGFRKKIKMICLNFRFGIRKLDGNIWHIVNVVIVANMPIYNVKEILHLEILGDLRMLCQLFQQDGK